MVTALCGDRWHDTCGEHNGTYRHVESLGHAPETHVTSCVNYTSIFKKERKKESHALPPCVPRGSFLFSPRTVSSFAPISLLENAGYTRPKPLFPSLLFLQPRHVTRATQAHRPSASLGPARTLASQGGVWVGQVVSKQSPSSPCAAEDGASAERVPCSASLLGVPPPLAEALEQGQ